jgi:hypothetical protein
MARFQIISEDLYNRNQSWYFVGVYRSSSVVRVEVRANAHEDQSHAKIEVWGRDGWNFHASIPTQDWYSDAPSYARKREDFELDVFHWLRDELILGYVRALWGAYDVELMPFEGGVRFG